MFDAPGVALANDELCVVGEATCSFCGLSISPVRLWEVPAVRAGLFRVELLDGLYWPDAERAVFPIDTLRGFDEARPVALPRLWRPSVKR